QRTGPVVIAGDLNLSDRTHGYRILLSDFRDAMRAGAWAGDTFEQGIWRYALLRIDHLFVSRSWCAKDPSRFTVTGSTRGSGPPSARASWRNRAQPLRSLRICRAALAPGAPVIPPPG
ncbi:MAG: endonuclease/exonuclease/phosphatase family protein, partial [Actinomycetota bacterium]